MTDTSTEPICPEHTLLLIDDESGHWHLEDMLIVFYSSWEAIDRYVPPRKRAGPVHNDILEYYAIEAKLHNHDTSRPTLTVHLEKYTND